MPPCTPLIKVPAPMPETNVAFVGKPYWRIETPDGSTFATCVKQSDSLMTGTTPAGAGQGGVGAAVGAAADDDDDDDNDDDADTAERRPTMIKAGREASILQSEASSATPTDGAHRADENDPSAATTSALL